MKLNHVIALTNRGAEKLSEDEQARVLELGKGLLRHLHSIELHVDTNDIVERDPTGAFDNLGLGIKRYFVTNNFDIIGLAPVMAKAPLPPHHVLVDAAFACAVWVLFSADHQMRHDIRVEMKTAETNHIGEALYVKEKVRQPKPVPEGINKYVQQAIETLRRIESGRTSPSKKVIRSLFSASNWAARFQSLAVVTGSVYVASLFEDNQGIKDATLHTALDEIAFYTELESYLRGPDFEGARLSSYTKNNWSSRNSIKSRLADLMKRYSDQEVLQTAESKIVQFILSSMKRVRIPNMDKQDFVLNRLVHNVRQYIEAPLAIDRLLIKVISLAGSYTKAATLTQSTTARAESLLMRRLDWLDGRNMGVEDRLSAIYLMALADDQETALRALEKIRTSIMLPEDDSVECALCTDLTSLASNPQFSAHVRDKILKGVLRLTDVIDDKYPYFAIEKARQVAVNVQSGSPLALAASRKVIDLIDVTQDNLWPNVIIDHALVAAQTDASLYAKAEMKIDAVLKAVGEKKYPANEIYERFGAHAEPFVSFCAAWDALGPAVTETVPGQKEMQPLAVTKGAVCDNWARLCLRHFPTIIGNLPLFVDFSLDVKNTSAPIVLGGADSDMTNPVRTGRAPTDYVNGQLSNLLGSLLHNIPCNSQLKMQALDLSIQHLGRIQRGSFAEAIDLAVKVLNFAERHPDRSRLAALVGEKWDNIIGLHAKKYGEQDALSDLLKQICIFGSPVALSPSTEFVIGKSITSLGGRVVGSLPSAEAARVWRDDINYDIRSLVQAKRVSENGPLCASWKTIYGRSGLGSGPN